MQQNETSYGKSSFSWCVVDSAQGFMHLGKALPLSRRPGPLFIFYFEIGYHQVVQTVLELIIPLPQSPE